MQSKNNQVDFHVAEFVGEADFRSCQFGNIYFNREYPADSDKISREANKTKFLQKADFSEAFFGNMVNLFSKQWALQDGHIGSDRSCYCWSCVWYFLSRFN